MIWNIIEAQALQISFLIQILTVTEIQRHCG